jgi:hypothetical protein
MPMAMVKIPSNEATRNVAASKSMKHVLDRWRIPLRDLGDDRLETPEYRSRWKTLYSVDAVLEHAVMHPIRHAFQLEELMRER